MESWYEVQNIDQLASPALLLYPKRIAHNIELLKSMVDHDSSRVRPHVKTHKMLEVSKMMIDAGIDQFKCSTIAEAEMLALANAKDVLLAYQPVGPNIKRWQKLILAYPNTQFSCLLDNVNSIQALNDAAVEINKVLDFYLDVDLGMGRTGAAFSQIKELWETIRQQENLRLQGVHGYDGQINNPDVEVRKKEADSGFDLLQKAHDFLQEQSDQSLKIVVGGSPSFTAHAERKNVACSPGTFVFWDWGYSEKIPEQKFKVAAVLLARVISVINENRICIDLGYKAVASESPLPRVKFLNAIDAVPVLQSEEHMVLTVDDSHKYPVGTSLFAIPLHICPTVALYEKVAVIEDKEYAKDWQVIARNRALNI
ncbi:D-TA family PLP-dependent enzyme [Sphingobacterium cellulitidis]|uniref:D-TA family PLP-dependent enzyme n=1 Tax=Sphingobacterium cellulitidis TaxID=1768011 RepID=UPI000B945484|nr:threonine aldolase [Sphingobacterium cellulitidis]